MQIRDPHAAPTPAQISFLERLTAERQVSAASASDDLDTLRQWLAAGANRGQVSALIERLKGLPRRKAAESAVDVQIGMYVTDTGVMHRVYKARGGSHLLVKRLDGSDAAGWAYTYVGNAARVLPRLSGLRRLTLEEAKGWGKRTGTCCVCSARLTDGESIDMGLGPICRKSFGTIM